jgi:hypothetical protein
MGENGISVAPLPAGFMLTSLVGILLSIVWIYPQSESWGLGTGIIFVVMFVSSVISMSYGPSEVELGYYKRVIAKAEKKKARK